jgi:hypothetical protein
MRRVQLPAASTVPSFEVQLERDSSNEKFILTIVNPRAERLDIKLSFGTAGFSDTTRESAYRKRINFEGTEDGTYVLTVRGEKKTITKNIRLQTSTQTSRSVSW